jgi:precorrin isomerase
MNNTQHSSRTSETDIVVHIEEDLDAQYKHRVEYTMLKAAGIGYACFDKYRKHLLIIGYDPAQTDASRILELVKQQHLNPQLITGI